MTDVELARVQVNAATDYLHRTSNNVRLDIRSCIFWARALLT